MPFEQLALNLTETEAPTLENFDADGNREAVAALAACRAGTGPQFICLWGRAGSGRTHLLRALTPKQSRRVPEFDERIRLYTADNVEAFDAEDMERLFILMNEVRAHPASRLVTSVDRPPLMLAVREDIRSRLAWGLTFEIRPLNAEHAMAEFERRAVMRGIDLSPEVLHWIETTCPRDMKTLMRLLNAADVYSLQRKRRVTIPLMQQLLETL